MADVLLDSSTYIDLERANRHRKLPWASTALRHAFTHRTTIGPPSLSIVTVIEILNGLERNADASKAQIFKQEVARSFHVIDLECGIAYLTAEIMARLETTGNGIGLADSIIAATAVHENLTLVTSNERHFRRVTDLGYFLRLANWRYP